ncbi:hypothetical protein MD484_g5625, partial [Candolleomyces efflorescens]
MACKGTEEHLSSLIAQAKTKARVRAIRTVKGMYFGTDCSSPHLVPVPVQKSLGNPMRPVDALFTTYIPVTMPETFIVLSLDRFIIHVPQYPADSRVPDPFSYTIFFSNCPFDKPNRLLRKLAGDVHITVRGPILVVKSDQKGVIKPIVKAETRLMEKLVTAPHLPMPRRSTKPIRYADDMSVSAMRRAITASPLSRGDTFSRSYISGLMSKPPKDSPASVIFALALPELVQEILSWCDFPTLMAISRVNQHFRELAMVAVRIRLRDHVAPFIPRLDFWPFMDMLNATGGAIVGSVPRMVLSENAIFNALHMEDGGARFSPPHNMNLIVRHGMLELARDWLTQHGGYSVWEKVKLHGAFREVALEIYRGTRPATTSSHYFES